MEETIKLFFSKYPNINDYFIDYLGIKEEDLYKIRESLLESD